jgi:hypothetical protein
MLRFHQYRRAVNSIHRNGVLRCYQIRQRHSRQKSLLRLFISELLLQTLDVKTYQFGLLDYSSGLAFDWGVDHLSVKSPSTLSKLFSPLLSNGDPNSPFNLLGRWTKDTLNSGNLARMNAL